MPLLDDLFLKNPVRLVLSKYGLLNATTYMVDFARTLLNARIDPKVCATVRQDLDYVRNDFLSRLLATHTKDLEFVTNGCVLALTVA